MSNGFYNPYDQNIQWGEGLAEILPGLLKKITGMGGKKSGGPAIGGQGMGFQGGGAQGETMGGGSPAQAYSSAGASAGAKGASGMTPEMEQMLAEFLMSLGL